MENKLHSIFEPRQAFDKNGVKCDYIAPGKNGFDQYYIDYTIKQVPVPIAECSDDYLLVMKVVEDKRDIKETIQSQANQVGLEAMLQRYKDTGDASVLPSPVQATDEIMDFTKLPQDNAEYFEYIHGLAAAYENLPIELRQDMTMEEFVKNITDKQVNDYLDTFKSKEEIKDE